MSRRSWIYNSTLLAGLIFVALGVRLYFRKDITGTVVHLALALVLFVAAILTGDGRSKDSKRGDL